MKRIQRIGNRLTVLLPLVTLMTAAMTGVCHADMMHNTGTPFWHWLEFAFCAVIVAFIVNIILLISGLFLLAFCVKGAKKDRAEEVRENLIIILYLFVGMITIPFFVGFLAYVYAFIRIYQFNKKVKYSGPKGEGPVNPELEYENGNDDRL